MNDLRKKYEELARDHKRLEREVRDVRAELGRLKRRVEILSETRLTNE